MSRFGGVPDSVQQVDPVTPSTVQSTGIASQNLNAAADRAFAARQQEMAAKHEAERLEFQSQRAEQMQQEQIKADQTKQETVNQSFKDTANIEAQSRQKLQQAEFQQREMERQQMLALDRAQGEREKAIKRMDLEQAFGMKMLDLKTENERTKAIKDQARYSMMTNRLQFGLEKSDQEYAKALMQIDAQIGTMARTVSEADAIGKQDANVASQDLGTAITMIETAQERALSDMGGVAEAAGRGLRAGAEALGITASGGGPTGFAGEGEVPKPDKVQEDLVGAWAKGLTDSIVSRTGSNNPEAIEGAVKAILFSANKRAAMLDAGDPDAAQTTIDEFWGQLAPQLKVLDDSGVPLTSVFSAIESLSGDAQQRISNYKQEMLDPEKWDPYSYRKQARDSVLEALEGVRKAGAIVTSSARGKVQRSVDTTAMSSAVKLAIAESADDQIMEELWAKFKDTPGMAKDWVQDLIHHLPVHQMKQAERMIAELTAQGQLLDESATMRGIEGEENSLSIEEQAINDMREKALSGLDTLPSGVPDG